MKHVFGAVALCLPLTALHAQPTRPNLLLITLDTVRADRLGAYGYQRGCDARAGSSRARGCPLRGCDDAARR